MYNNLNDTVALMNSSDYKDRFIAEYWQTKIRYDKLHQMLVKYDAGKLDFTPSCPIEVLREQKQYMGMYLNKLEVRAVIEGIDLNTVCNKVSSDCNKDAVSKMVDTISEKAADKLNTLTITSCKQAKEFQKAIEEMNKQENEVECQKIIRQMMDFFYDGQTLYDRFGETCCIGILKYSMPDSGDYHITMGVTWSKNSARSKLTTEENFNLIYELWENTKNR